MKTLFISIISITLVSTLHINVRAQNKIDSANQRSNFETTSAQYLKKSHDQRKISSIMFIGGGSMALIGGILAVSSLDGLFDPNAPIKNYGSAPDILGIGGMVIVAAAIPIMIAAKANKKKAKLYMSEENISISPGVQTNSSLIAMGIKINF